MKKIFSGKLIVQITSHTDLSLLSGECGPLEYIFLKFKLYSLWLYFPCRWLKLTTFFLLSRPFEDLILRDHLGLEGASGSFSLPINSCSICVRTKSKNLLDHGFTWKLEGVSFSLILFVDWTLARVIWWGLRGFPVMYHN